MDSTQPSMGRKIAPVEAFALPPSATEQTALLRNKGSGFNDNNLLVRHHEHERRRKIIWAAMITTLIFFVVHRYIHAVMLLPTSATPPRHYLGGDRDEHGKRRRC